MIKNSSLRNRTSLEEKVDNAKWIYLRTAVHLICQFAGLYIYIFVGGEEEERGKFSLDMFIIELKRIAHSWYWISVKSIVTRGVVKFKIIIYM